MTASNGVVEERYNPFTPLISERAVDQPRPIKVIYIGAGISGILAAIKFREAVPNLHLTIYEKNPDLGGTWYENRYPGCACGEQSGLREMRQDTYGYRCPIARLSAEFRVMDWLEPFLLRRR